jgi:transcriptional regulator with XRE-family HTH domain
MNHFGDALRQLMEAKKVSGLKLAEDIGISTTSVSRILNGQSRPRQVTLSRIMKALCQDRSEEQALLRAYSGLDTLPEERALNDERNAQANEERVRRFLEVKTQSILFKRSVAKELDKAGIAYVQDYCKGAISTDFLIESGGHRIALECRFNVQRDLERAVLTANFLKKELGCNMVITVTPFDVSDTLPAENDFVSATPGEAVELLRKAGDA